MSAKTEYIDSWDPFKLNPRHKWYQALYIGLLWSALVWGTICLGIVYLITRSGG